MKQQNRLYVHCGFHKTGSTALQAALRASEAPLRQAGFLYPYTGSGDRPGKEATDPHKHAHHNIAHEVDRHWLFNAHEGTLDELKEEIKNFPGDIIISSELFETIITRPESFGFLKNLAHFANKKLTIIVYLRNQILYAQSLYLELLNYEFSKEYLAYADEILTHGCIKCRGLTHQFDYERVLNSWKQVPGVDVIARNYHALSSGSVVTDFAQCLGLGDRLRSRPGHEALNVRGANFPALHLFYHGRVRRHPNFAEISRIKYLTRNQIRLTSSAAMQRKFIEKFQESNLRLCEAWGVPTDGLDMKDKPQPPSAVTLEQFFSFETQCAIWSGAIPDTRFAPAETRQTGWMAGIETADANMPFADMMRYWREKLGQYRRWYVRRARNLLPFMASSELR